MWFLGGVLVLLLLMAAEQRAMLRRPRLWARLALFPMDHEREVRLPPQSDEGASYRGASLTFAAVDLAEATGRPSDTALLLPAGSSLVLLLRNAARSGGLTAGLLRIDAEPTIDPGTLRLRARYAPAPVLALAVVSYITAAGVLSLSFGLSARALLLFGYLVVVFAWGFRRLRHELPKALDRVAREIERG